MWARTVAIRPVPRHAVVEHEVVLRAHRELSVADEDDSDESLHAIHDRMSKAQPAITERLMQALSRDLDETAVALGFFLTLVVFRSFELAFKESLKEVSASDLDASDRTLAAEVELRSKEGNEPVDWEEAVLHEQPGLLGFVNEQIDAALSGADNEVDVDDVHAIFRTIVLVVIALSHAVEGTGDRELLA